MKLTVMVLRHGEKPPQFPDRLPLRDYRRYAQGEHVGEVTNFRVEGSRVVADANLTDGADVLDFPTNVAQLLTPNPDTLRERQRCVALADAAAWRWPDNPAVRAALKSLADELREDADGHMPGCDRKCGTDAWGVNTCLPYCD